MRSSVVSSVTAIDLRLGLLVGLGLSNGDGVSDANTLPFEVNTEPSLYSSPQTSAKASGPTDAGNGPT